MYEVLGGTIPYKDRRDPSVVMKFLGGERANRPPGAEGGWFADDIRNLFESCWQNNPGNRLNLDNMREFLERISMHWVLPRRVAGPPAADWSNDEKTQIGEASASPPPAIPRQQPQRPLLEGNANKTGSIPPLIIF